MSIKSSDIEEALKNVGLSKERIEKMFRKKVEQFGDFMGREGILAMIANELGVNIQNCDIDAEMRGGFLEEEVDYTEFQIKISEIEEGASNFVLVGRIKSVFPIREFNRKDGTPGIVGSFILVDASDEVKVVLWGIEHSKSIKNEYFKINEVVRVLADYSKTGRNDLIEVHIGRNGKVFLSPKDIDPSKIPLIESSSSLYDNSCLLKAEEINLSIKQVNIQGVIDIIYEAKRFERKDKSDDGIVKNIILRDETGTRNLTFWDEQASVPDYFQEGATILFSRLKVVKNEYRKSIDLVYNQNSKYKIISLPHANRDCPEFLSINKLRSKKGNVRSTIIGTIIEINKIREIIKKDGDVTFLLKFVLSDDTSAIIVNAWGDLALEIPKIIEQDGVLELSNVLVNLNEYSHDEEITLTKSSRIKMVEI